MQKNVIGKHVMLFMLYTLQRHLLFIYGSENAEFSRLQSSQAELLKHGLLSDDSRHHVEFRPFQWAVQIHQTQRPPSATAKSTEK